MLHGAKEEEGVMLGRWLLKVDSEFITYNKLGSQSKPPCQTRKAETKAMLTRELKR